MRREPSVRRRLRTELAMLTGRGGSVVPLIWHYIPKQLRAPIACTRGELAKRVTLELKLEENHPRGSPGGPDRTALASSASLLDAGHRNGSVTVRDRRRN